MSNNLDLDQVAGNQDQKEVTINDQAGQLDAAITEFVTIDVTSSNQTVTAEQYRRNVAIVITGATTPGRSVTLQAIKRLIVIASDSTATQSVDIILGSTSFALPAQETRVVYTDGTANGLFEVGGGGSGASDFLGLSDTPGTYAGSSLKAVRVNVGETGLEFGDVASSGGGAAASSIPPFKGCLVTKAVDLTTQDLTVGQVLTWDSEAYDTDAFHDNSTNPSRITIPVGAGVTKVQLTANIKISSLSTAGDFTFEIRKNGSASVVGLPSFQARGAESFTSEDFNIKSASLEVSEGDYFEVFVQLGADTSTTVDADDSWFSCTAVETSANATAVGRPPFKGAVAKIGANFVTSGSAERVDGWSSVDFDTTVEGLKFWLGPDLTFTADNTTDNITATSHGMSTGDGPLRLTNSGGALPSPLASATNYWVIEIDANTIQLATSFANAQALTQIDITDDGTGTQTLDRAARLVVPGDTVTKVKLAVALDTLTTTTPEFIQTWIYKNNVTTFPGVASDTKDTGSTSGNRALRAETPVLVVTGGDFFEVRVDMDVDIDDTNATYFSLEVFEDSDTAHYDVGGSFGGSPTANEVVFQFLFPRTVTFPAGLSPSVGKAGVAATALSDFDLRKNGVSFGTMSWAASGTVATFTAATDTTFSPGDEFLVVGPNPADGTLADLSYTFAGRR